MDSTTLQQTGLKTGTWAIDPSHSEVAFSVRHLMSKVRGTFGTFEGQIEVAENVAESKATASIDLSSINTQNEDRDNHVRSSDFFDIENHPAMTFTSTSVQEDTDGYRVTGDLTIRGVTKPVTLAAEFLGIDQDPWGNTRVGFEATAEISRKEFGVDFNIPLEGGKLLIGDKVTIHLALEAVLQS
ncbi:MAG: polyisoprenoid-binding protein [Propionibacteriales bacterium]|nr:polyisoprenoid-binding protein [Propionibacteriales bacterium]